MDTKTVICIIAAVIVALGSLIFLLKRCSIKRKQQKAEAAALRMQELDEAISNKRRHL